MATEILIAKEKKGIPTWLWWAGPVFLTFLTYLPSLQNGFVAWDDPGYVLNNHLVQNFDLKGFFSTLSVMGNYHPLSLVSLGIDYLFQGNDPFIFHSHNLFLHLLNTALVYFIFQKLMGRNAPAALIALLFGIHPMHVEAVAWISQRKDVLYTFYYLSALLAYVKYISSSEKKSLFYLLTLFLFGLSLLAKGMAVTFPVILILVDFLQERKGIKRLLLEKVPFFLISLGFGLIALKAQSQGNAIQETDISFLESISSGSYGLLMYLLKSIVPFHLSSFHPYPQIPGQNVPSYFYMLLLFTSIGLGGFIYLFRKKRKVLFGTGFFLVSIGPVLQFLPVGIAIYAERYSYLSYLGLFFMIAVALQYLIQKNKKRKPVILTGVGIWILVLAMLSFVRIGVWENGETLFNDVVKKYPKDFFAYASRADLWLSQGSPKKALMDLDAALLRNPQFYEGYNNRGLVYFQMGNLSQAQADFSQSIQLNPDFGKAYINRALVWLNLEQPGKALADLDLGLQLDPESVEGHFNRGLALQSLHRPVEAFKEFDFLLKKDPLNPNFRQEKAWTLLLMGELEQGLNEYNALLADFPQEGKAWYRRSLAHADLKNFSQAIYDAGKARELGYQVSPGYFQTLQDSLR